MKYTAVKDNNISGIAIVSSIIPDYPEVKKGRKVN